MDKGATAGGPDVGQRVRTAVHRLLVLAEAGDDERCHTGGLK